MANPYYTPTGNPTSASLARAASIRAEFEKVEDAFDALATQDFTANGIRVGKGTGANGSNTAVGIDALDNYASGGGGCTAVGNMALSTLTTGASNTAVGDDALLTNSTADDNTAVGRDALRAMTSGSNTAVGAYAMSAADGGISNTGIGVRSLQSATGSRNTAIGQQSGNGASFSGNNNTIVGYSIGSGLSSGSNNTLVGCLQASGPTTGSNNTVVGYQAQPSATTVDNEITLGNGSIATLRCQVTSITSLSDERDKTAISDLSFGLDFIRSIRPVAFTWNARDGSKVGIRSSGFIAQELKTAQSDHGAAEVLRLVYEATPDRLEASYGHLIPVMVKAIQELAAEVQSLRNQLNG